MSYDAPTKAERREFPQVKCRTLKCERRCAVRGYRTRHPRTLTGYCAPCLAELSNAQVVKLVAEADKVAKAAYSTKDALSALKVRDQASRPKGEPKVSRGPAKAAAKAPKAAKARGRKAPKPKDPKAS